MSFWLLRSARALHQGYGLLFWLPSFSCGPTPCRCLDFLGLGGGALPSRSRAHGLGSYLADRYRWRRGQAYLRIPRSRPADPRVRDWAWRLPPRRSPSSSSSDSLQLAWLAPDHGSSTGSPSMRSPRPTFREQCWTRLALAVGVLGALRPTMAGSLVRDSRGRLLRLRRSSSSWPRRLPGMGD